MLTALLQTIKDFFVTGFWSLLIVIAILRASVTRLILDLKAKGWLTYLDYVPPFRVWLVVGASILAIVWGRRAVMKRPPLEEEAQSESSLSSSSSPQATTATGRTSSEKTAPRKLRKEKPRT